MDIVMKLAELNVTPAMPAGLMLLAILVAIVSIRAILWCVKKVVEVLVKDIAGIVTQVIAGNTLKVLGGYLLFATMLLGGLASFGAGLAGRDVPPELPDMKAIYQDLVHQSQSASLQPHILLQATKEITEAGIEGYQAKREQYLISKSKAQALPLPPAVFICVGLGLTVLAFAVGLKTYSFEKSIK